jgi:hypothetical protein
MSCIRGHPEWKTLWWHLCPEPPFRETERATLNTGVAGPQQYDEHLSTCHPGPTNKVVCFTYRAIQSFVLREEALVDSQVIKSTACSVWSISEVGPMGSPRACVCVCRGGASLEGNSTLIGDGPWPYTTCWKPKTLYTASSYVLPAPGCALAHTWNFPFPHPIPVLPTVLPLLDVMPWSPRGANESSHEASIMSWPQFHQKKKKAHSA